MICIAVCCLHPVVLYSLLRVSSGSLLAVTSSVRAGAGW